MNTSLRSPIFLVGAGVVLATALALALVPGLIHALFSPGLFMPHAHCYLDNPQMLWLQGLSDFLIGLAYMVISATLAYLVFKARKDIPFEWMFLAFGIFIFSCGWTHFLEVWTLWHPVYWLSGAIKAVTAVASVTTALGVFILTPHIFRFIQAAKASEQRRLDLARAHRELSRTYKDLEVLSYSLSHDLRTPLRAVRSFSLLVLDEHRDQLNEEGRMLMEKIVAAAKRMDRLVEDVQALSRLSRAPAHPQPVDLERLVEQLVEGRPDLQPPHVELELQRPLLPVQGDTGSLNQALDNLLSNAVKFVPPGVKPRVRIYTEAQGEKVRLWVADNGIGIPAEGRQKIFEPFQRLHRQEEYEGTGIGLAIVQKAVQRMEGDLGVESDPGQGSRFWIELAAVDVADWQAVAPLR